MNTIDTSSRDHEKTLSTPGMEETASSIGRVTLSSTSSGLAPGYTVVSVTNGNETSG